MRLVVFCPDTISGKILVLGSKFLTSSTRLLNVFCSSYSGHPKGLAAVANQLLSNATSSIGQSVADLMETLQGRFTP
jgi:hypothetical protein